MDQSVEELLTDLVTRSIIPQDHQDEVQHLQHLQQLQHVDDSMQFNISQTSLNEPKKRGRKRKHAADGSIIPDDGLDLGNLDPNAPVGVVKEERQVHLDWNIHYAALLEYFREHGHCNVPYLDKYECNLVGMAQDGGVLHYYGCLGSWLTRQRRYKRGLRGTLTPEREALLQHLVDQGAFMWDNSEMSATVKMKKQGDIDWPRHYAALLEYCKQHGHCNVHKKYKFENYECILPGMGDDGGDYHYSAKLGTWLANQRAFHTGRRGEKRKLPPEREMLLQQLVNDGKLLWDASTLSGTRLQGAMTWPINYAALLEYRKEYGHCNVPQTFVYECFLPGMGENGEDVQYHGPLGRWLMTQRQCKRGQRNSLQPERQALLQVLVDEGVMVWELSDLHGQIQVKTNFPSKMTKKIDLEWYKTYLALIEYDKEYGHCNVPMKEVYKCNVTLNDGSVVEYSGKLGGWLRVQRLCHRLYLAQQEGGAALARAINKYTQQAAKASSSSSSSSNINVNSVTNSMDETGSASGLGENGSSSSVSGEKGDVKYTGSGKKRRKKFMHHPLSHEKNALLQELVDAGKLLWDARERRGHKQIEGLGVEWNRHYHALLRYGEQYGHYNIPQCQSYECILPGLGDNGEDYHYSGRLGIWLCTQRQSRKGGRSKLTEDREKLLQELVDQGLLLWDVSHFSSVRKSKIHGDEEWPIHYTALLKYYEMYGTCNIPPTHTYECDIILQLPLDEDGQPMIVQALITPLYDPSTVADFNQPLGYHYNGKLGFWLSRQRYTRRHHKLLPEREELLQNLVEEGKLSWETVDPRKSMGDITWGRHYAALLEYGKQYGHYNVTLKTIFECVLPGMGENGEDYPYKANLGFWLNRQRQAKKGQANSKPLSPEREELLQKLVDDGQLLWEIIDRPDDKRRSRRSLAAFHAMNPNYAQEHQAALAAAAALSSSSSTAPGTHIEGGVAGSTYMDEEDLNIPQLNHHATDDMMAVVNTATTTTTTHEGETAANTGESGEHHGSVHPSVPMMTSDISTGTVAVVETETSVTTTIATTTMAEEVAVTMQVTENSSATDDYTTSITTITTAAAAAAAAVTTTEQHIEPTEHAVHSGDNSSSSVIGIDSHAMVVDEEEINETSIPIMKRGKRGRVSKKAHLSDYVV